MEQFEVKVLPVIQCGLSNDNVALPSSIVFQQEQRTRDVRRLLIAMPDFILSRVRRLLLLLSYQQALNGVNSLEGVEFFIDFAG